MNPNFRVIALWSVKSRLTDVDSWKSIHVYPLVYYSAIILMYRHVVCNVQVSCKAYGVRNQLGYGLSKSRKIPKSHILASFVSELSVQQG